MKNLREQGKIVFLISNNWALAGKELLQASMGKDYKDYFDIIIFDADKPEFMYDQSEKPFRRCFSED